MCRAVLCNVSYDGALGCVHGLANPHHHEGRDDRQKKAEQWTREGYDNLVERLYRRQGLLLFLRLSGLSVLPLHGLHGRHLRQRHKAPCRNPTQAVLYSVDFFLPNGLTKPDLETIHAKPPPLCGKKMPELVDKDNDVEERHHDEDINKKSHC